MDVYLALLEVHPVPYNISNFQTKRQQKHFAFLTNYNEKLQPYKRPIQKALHFYENKTQYYQY